MVTTTQSVYPLPSKTFKNAGFSLSCKEFVPEKNVLLPKAGVFETFWKAREQKNMFWVTGLGVMRRISDGRYVVLYYVHYFVFPS